MRQCALDLHDTILLAKLSAGDLISQEAVYHNKCLVSLYNRAKRSTPHTLDNNANDEHLFSGIALAELLSYIEDLRVSSNIHVLKLSDLTQLYTKRLEQLGCELKGRIHSTDLKNRILANLPELQAYKQGRDVLLAFNEDIGNALKIVSERDCDDEAVILSKAAKIVRRDMGNWKYIFDGSFEPKCQKQSIPASLLCLVSMIIRGSNIETNSKDVSETQTALTIAQLLQYNCTFRRVARQGATQSHSVSREPPLPTYVGIIVHAKTRMKGLIDKLFDLGLSIPYSRVIAISTNLGNQILSQFAKDNVVCPANMKQNVFTTAAVDNIDHNTSSSTATSSLHGTGISLFQHPTSKEEEGLRKCFTFESVMKEDKLLPLPESYASVPPLVMPKHDPTVPAIYQDIPSSHALIAEAMEKEQGLVHCVFYKLIYNHCKCVNLSLSLKMLLLFILLLKTFLSLINSYSYN